MAVMAVCCSTGVESIGRITERDVARYGEKQSAVKDEVLDLLKEWLKVRKAKRAAMTDRAIQMNIEKLEGLAQKSEMTIIEYLKEVICRGWAAFYEIKNFNTKENSNNGQNTGNNGSTDGEGWNIDPKYTL